MIDPETTAMIRQALEARASGRSIADCVAEYLPKGIPAQFRPARETPMEMSLLSTAYGRGVAFGRQDYILCRVPVWGKGAA